LIKKSAIISDCGKYRYELRRKLSNNSGKLLFIMLNPSIADSNIDDATAYRCMKHTRDIGYGELIVANIFAYRSTDPKVLLDLNIQTLIGPKNEEHLYRLAKEANLIICGWGSYGYLFDRGFTVYKELILKGFKLHCFKRNQSKFGKFAQPSHPLYLSKKYRIQGM